MKSHFSLTNKFYLQYQKFVHADAVDAFCIKLYKIGGITPAKKIAAIAEAGNVLLNGGGLAVQPQLEAAAGAHFYASIPEKRMMSAGEFLFGLNTTAPDPLVSETEFVVKMGALMYQLDMAQESILTMTY